MTDDPGHRPRTATVALLAPAAAAVLAGSLAWAAEHPPAPLTTSATTVSPAADPSAGRAEQVRDIERLRKEVTSLRSELQELAGADRRPGSPRNGATAPATTKPKPTRTAPPVHATTGAS